jgi:hypothetical protein
LIFLGETWFPPIGFTRKLKLSRITMNCLHTEMDSHFHTYFLWCPMQSSAHFSLILMQFCYLLFLLLFFLIFSLNIINRHNNSLIQVFHNICSYYKQQIFQEVCSTVRYEYLLRIEFKFIPLLNGLQLFLCSENIRSI